MKTVLVYWGLGGLSAQVSAKIKEEGVVIHVRKRIDFKENMCMLVVK